MAAAPQQNIVGIVREYGKRLFGFIRQRVPTDADAEDVLHFKDILLAVPDTPETEYFRQLFWDGLFAALDELPTAQREVFVWNELEDQTFQEIADRTGENIKTLISRKRYAVQHLRVRLNTLYQEVVNF